MTFNTLVGLLDKVWEQLARGAADRHAPVRFAVLATVGHTGGAEARTVVLRAAAREPGRVEIFTDARTAKVRELAGEPRASLVTWDPATRLQVRLRSAASILTGEAVADRWAFLPAPARRDYAAIMVPGSATAPEDLRDPAPGPDNFAVISLEIDEIDAVHLGDDRHRRALYRRADAWRGTWLQP